MELIRNLIRMVAILHVRGHECLYLDPAMSPSGMYWRYEIGAMERGRWPSVKQDVVQGSIGGDPSASIRA